VLTKPRSRRVLARTEFKEDSPYRRTISKHLVILYLQNLSACSDDVVRWPDREAYAAAECAAMKAKLGLWSDPHPIQPQDFRHGTNSPLLLLDPKRCRTSGEPVSGAVVGNARSHIFEWPACPYYSSISPDNRVPFSSPQTAEAAGYRPAHNCP
jgi:hypothetical protein